ncbi:MAG: class I SAM-dependent methyltransferase [Acidobacteriota bacterium]
MRRRTAGGAAVWSRFVDANKRFCKRRLQPRLYLVSHMTALDRWFERRSRAVAPTAALLEFGCGRTLRVTRLIGHRFSTKAVTDLQEVLPSALPEGVLYRQCTADTVPFDDEQFDVVVIRSVIEHVEDPDRTFRELARVTKPGGAILMNLPNKWDYVSVLARLAGRFKSWVLQRVVRTGWEDFPVRYRCNTRRALNKCAVRAELQVEEFVPLPSQPSYLSFFVPLYLAGAVYQFFISLLALDVLQPSFLVVLRKPDYRSRIDTSERRR